MRHLPSVWGRSTRSLVRRAGVSQTQTGAPVPSASGLLSLEERGCAADVSLLARPRTHTPGHQPTVAAVGYPAHCLIGLPVEASAGRAPRRCVASPVFTAARSAVRLQGSRACLPARTGSWRRSACWRAGEESQVAPEGASAGSRRVADASQPGSTIRSCAQTVNASRAGRWSSSEPRSGDLLPALALIHQAVGVDQQ